MTYDLFLENTELISHDELPLLLMTYDKLQMTFSLSLQLIFILKLPYKLNG